MMSGARQEAESEHNRSGDQTSAEETVATSGAGAGGAAARIASPLLVTPDPVVAPVADSGEAPAAKHDRAGGRLRAAAASVIAVAFGAFNAIPTAILGFLSLWLFVFFPWLRPWEPPVERKVTIGNVAIAEPRFTFPSTQEPMTVVLFDVEAVGYDADTLDVATLWLDATTGERVGANLHVHGKLTKPTRTDTSVVWLDVPQPPLSARVRSAAGERPGCLRVRVLIFPSNEPRRVEEATAAPTPIVSLGNRALVAYRDSPPFALYETQPDACQGLAGGATPPADRAGDDTADASSESNVRGSP